MSKFKMTIQMRAAAALLTACMIFAAPVSAAAESTAEPAVPAAGIEEVENLPETEVTTTAGVDLDALEDGLTLSSQPEDQAILKASNLPISADTMKVYNFTNYNVSSALDMENDSLVVPFSKEQGGVRAGDQIDVYVKDAVAGTADGYRWIAGEKLKEGTLGSRPIDLGTKNLNPSGGSIYVTLTRLSIPTVKVEVPYPAEANRQIYMKFFRSGGGEHSGEEVDPDSSAWNNLKKDEKIQLRIYVNDVRDLTGFTIPIHFNPYVVKVADSAYEPCSTGAIRQAAFENGDCGLSLGEDMVDLTSGEEPLWNGGIVFTERTESPETGYPYIDNNNGLLKLMMASDSVSPVFLSKEGGYHVLSVNFLVVSENNSPEFRFAVSTDAYYDKASENGASIAVIMPEENGGSVAAKESWQMYSMKDILEDPQIRLSDGNGLADDLFPGTPGTDEEKALAEQLRTTAYLYAGFRYRDPGFQVKTSDGSSGKLTDVKRYYEKNGVRIDLPSYVSGEAINAADTGFLPANDTWGLTNQPGEYALKYEFTDPLNPSASAVITRSVVVIPMKGDLNGDGRVNNSDLVVMAAHLTGLQTLTLSNETFVKRVADVDGSGTVDAQDAVLLDQYALLGAPITWDYPFNADEKIMEKERE